MRIPNRLYKTGLITVLLLWRLAATGQVKIYGTVYDRSVRFGMPGVSVKSTSGAGAVTDSLGHYSIFLPFTDSVSFSYQGKSTQKFPVKDIPRSRSFDMSLHVDIHTLPTVVVSARPRDYRFDSLENRNEYRKAFDYDPQLLSPGNGLGGVGINLSMLFGSRKIKRMEAFRRLLERDERDKYVSHRFNKDLVKKITGLQPPALDTFMRYYRPSYEMLHSFENEYEYLKYIKDESEYFSEIWERNHR